MKSFWTTIFLLIAFSVFSQKQDSGMEYVPDQFIIQLQDEIDSDNFFQKVKAQFEESGILFYPANRFSKTFNLYLLQSQTEIEDVDRLLSTLLNFPEVLIATQNFKVQIREKIPNDPMFTSQWGMEIINAPEVWEFTTGGVTALGDTIVVAMIESGDWRHDDLIDNVWINWNEINNDGIDNDGNGYIDDYFGWNVVDSTDMIGVDPLSHGLLVGGIIGATGDNEMGIAGVNWNVKIMWVHHNLFVNKIIEAYEYVLETRKLFNETDGEKGAFVVATNGSIGIPGDSPQYPDGLQLEDNPLFPIWCDLHQLLGEQGVLGVGSTSNKEFDVDELGDMPSICSSDHLIVVAENNMEDELNSGYGKINVDLTAPGEGTPSTFGGNLYGNLDGTSAAAPHVAGGIALLYSLPCEKLAQAARENPAATSLIMKEFILNGVDNIVEQVDKTVSGGRLNLEKSMNLIQGYCGSGLDILTINSIGPNPTEDVLNVWFTPNAYGKYKIEIFNAIGQLMAESEFTAVEFLPSFFQIEGFNSGIYAPGVYFLTLSNDLDFTTVKFVVY